MNTLATPAEGPARVTVRRLWITERSLICAHLKRLSPENRYLRFGGHVGDEFLDRYCESMDWFRSVLIGAFVDGELRGVGEFRRFGEGFWPSSAELAVSVEGEVQDHGIGSILFRRLIVYARNRAVDNMYIMCLRNNHKLKHIAAKHEFTLKSSEDDVEGLLELAGPTYASWMEEAWEEGRAWLRDGYEQTLGQLVAG